MSTPEIRFSGNTESEIAKRGFAWIPRSTWSIAPDLAADLERLRGDWEHLELDRYLTEGSLFRRRRYGRLFWAPAEDVLEALSYEPYFQAEDDNGYAGGIRRDFAPVAEESLRNPFVRALVRACFECLPIPDERRRDTWEVRVHQVRTTATAAEPGLPTPEGIHQDGTDFHTLHLFRRENIEGGETTIYDLDRQPVFQCTMREVLDTVILEDPRIMHSVTPVTAANRDTEGYRDIFGFDFHHRPQLRKQGEARSSKSS